MVSTSKELVGNVTSDETVDAGYEDGGAWV
jgi:hypothetical protein